MFLENLYTGRDTPLQEGYVEDGWKYIRCYKASHPYTEAELLHEGQKPVWEMLFDLRQDPGELNNLIDSPKATAVANRMRSKCEQKVSQLNKTRGKYRAQYITP